MKHYALIGDPVAHSRSPIIYRSLFAKHDVDADFSLINVKKGELGTLRQLVSDLSGFTVTMPHKVDIIPYLDSLDVSAAECGSVNVVEKKDGMLIGHNTDGAGLVDSINETDYALNGRTALILGRGGAALSAACALNNAGCRSKLLVRDIREGIGFDQVIFTDRLIKADLFINASPLGMVGYNDFDSFGFLKSVDPDIVFDMVYLNDGETSLVKECRSRGVAVLDGHRLLYNQALRAFRIFTEIDP